MFNNAATEPGVPSS